ncbi:ABC transporter ATP-binding protein [uncultured Clostridium sp.]|uniref:ABC transporter ATP-binding protein n=1 Tax=uncultured Clostridium sp. TaxID=59620 RepID=UPI00262BA053|nr:ABC transporter ATP-binding protein [uncultured Clostridium sp.]
MAGGPTAKAKDFKGTMKRLFSYLKDFKVRMIVIFILAILATIFSVVSPKILGMAITKIGDGVMEKYKGVPNASVDFHYVFWILVILASLFVLSSVFLFAQKYVMASVAQKTVFKLRKEVEDKLNNLPLKYFDSHSKGDLLSRVTNDLENIGSTLQQSLNELITSLITVIGVAIMMFTINIWLALVCLIVIPIGIFGIKPIMKRSQKHFVAQQREIGKINGHIEEVYSGHKVIKSFNRETASIKELEEMNDRLYDCGWRAQFVSGIIMPFMRFVSNISYVAIAVLGGIFVTKGYITLGDIQAFIRYVNQFTQPMSQVANIMNVLQSTAASAERVFEILDEKEEVKEVENPIKLETVKGNVTFENVEFGYTKEKTLITNMNIEAKSGQTIAIVGPTGAGKTTLINLLMRFYDVNSGSIKIDGVDINEMTRKDLRSTFGMVLQDTWLFNGTIRDNIAYGVDNATFEEVVSAAKAAHADHFIRTLADGYDTILNEEASNISQGQKQLLTIARAILADPSILILDEATSSVDTRTEVFIQNAMNKLMEGRTSFVIAHRLSTIKDADIILVMKDGNVIESGNHNDLIEAKGFYEDLYNSQFAEDMPA